MKRLCSVFLACGFLLGCSVIAPPAAMAPGEPAASKIESATLEVAVRWPHRGTQVIPLSTQTIWIQVKKANQTLFSAPLARPEATDSLMVAGATIHLDAASGITVQADAFRSGQATTDIPIASRRADDVTLVANQRTSVLLDLDPAFRPGVTSVVPDNGGPGVNVSVGGTFGPSGSYQFALGAARILGALSDGKVVAAVPYGAQTGSVRILDDGVPSEPGPTFHVLSSLDVSPRDEVVAVGQSVPFQVLTGKDTTGLTIQDPVVTQWSLIDPARLNLPGSATSKIGTLSPQGLFTATATGTAWVYAWSGYLAATTSVTVH